MEKRYIKVNLPLTKADFRSGNGEGVFVIVDEKTASDYDKDAEGGTYTGILDNDSYYYPGLTCGCRIVFEMRGTDRPAALYDAFLTKFDSITQEEYETLIKKTASYRKPNS